MIPEQFSDLAPAILAAAEQDPRLVGVIAGGSVVTGTADKYSDLDLVLVSPTEADHRAVLAEAPDFAAKVGPLLAAFTGEHVGEPRLLITLYGPAPRHVDFKFVTLADLDHRVEDGLVLWDRDSSVQARLKQRSATWPRTDPQWIEDRFWVWVHYVTVKIGRGELFEAVDALADMRGSALAPLVIGDRVAKPSGVRRIEQIAPEHVPALRETVAMPDRADCLRALWATVRLYQELRGDVERRTDAEETALAYLREFS
ncbi:aminoglycoside 6-adenylyltransferase [Kribbella qitaiheensis]